jgi:hypothetical protein
MVLKERMTDGLNPEEVFLRERGISDPVRIAHVSENGHRESITWTGEGIIGVFDKDSIIKSQRTGCLRIARDGAEETLFVQAGCIIRTTNSRQIEMKLGL